MNDLLDTSLRLRIDNCMQTLRSAYELLIEQAEIYKKAERDVYIWQQALQTETQDSEEPYQKQRVPELSFNFNGTFDDPIRDRDSKPGLSPQGFAVPTPPLKKKGKPLDMSNDSPTGVLRQVFLSFNGATVSIDDLLARLSQKLEIEITRDDIYRIIPRMQKRGEIIRQGLGMYKYVGNELAELLEN